MQELIITKATELDIDVIIELAKSIWLPTYATINSDEQNNYMFSIWYSVDGLKKQMQEGQHFFLVKQNDQFIGYMSYTIINQHQFKLNKIYLKQELQGNGIGKRMLNFIENEAKQLGATTIILNVNIHNKALDFYQRLQYKIIKQENIPFGEFWMNDFVMLKEL